MDFASEGLLDGLEGEERSAREELLEHLASDGFTLDELREAVAEDRLVLLPVERVLAGKYTAKEMEEKTGLPADLWTRVHRLLGLPEVGPDERVFGEEDLKAAESTQTFLETGIDEDAVIQITRVLGEGMARVAATVTAEFARAFLRQGDSELDVARRFTELTEQLAPGMGPVLDSAYRAHLRDSVRRAMLSQRERQTGTLSTEQETGVCFIDLVGFTTLGGELEVDQLGGVIERFGGLAADVAGSRVRLVKTIGDAAMLSCRELEPLVEAALALLEAVEEADLPSARAGVACGQALQRGGDLYGHAVNLASRVTGTARPGSVLCTKEVRDAAPEAFDWSYTGKHRLKGIGRSVPLYRARRLAAAGKAAASEPKSDRRRKQASS